MKYSLRQIKRLEKRLKLIKESHKDQEQKLTYHAGYDRGYLEGMLAAIDRIQGDESPKE